MLQQWWLATWETVLLSAPWLLAGLVCSGLLHAVVPLRWVQRLLGGGGLRPVVLAAGIGVPLPICSCGVIPLAATLYRSGARVPAVLSFLVATPSASVGSVLLCWSLIGPGFALITPATASCAALLAAGLAVALRAVADKPQVAFVTPAAAGPEPSAGGAPKPKFSLMAPVKPCCAPKPLVPVPATAPSPKACCSAPAAQHTWAQRWHEFWTYALITVPGDIGRSILIGLALAGAIAVALPADSLGGVFGQGLWGKLLMVVAAVPVYVCSTSSVPVVAALIAKGVSPGTALVFLLAGPASNMATILTVRRILGARALLAYLLAVVAVSVGAGVVMDALWPQGGAWLVGAVSTTAMGHQHSSFAWWEQLAAVALVAIFAWAVLRSVRQRRH